MKTTRNYKPWQAGAKVLVLGFLLLLTYLFLASLVQYWRISMNSETASGVVQEKIAREDRGEGLMDLFVLRYSFTAAPDVDYCGQAGVSRAFYEKVTVGDRLAIEYAADDPGNNRVRGESDPQIVVTLAVVAVDVSLLVFSGLRRWLRTWRGQPDPRPLE